MGEQAGERAGQEKRAGLSLTGGQVELSFMQPVCKGVAKVDGDTEGEKVPAAQTVQVLSEVAAAADA